MIPDPFWDEAAGSGERVTGRTPGERRGYRWRKAVGTGAGGTVCAGCGVAIEGRRFEVQSARLEWRTFDEGTHLERMAMVHSAEWFHVACVSPARWAEWLGGPVKTAQRSGWRDSPRAGTKAFQRAVEKAAKAGTKFEWAEAPDERRKKR